VHFIETTAEDNCGHGTHVAGTIGAKHNNFGVVGVAPSANIWNVKIMKPWSPDLCAPTFSTIAQGIEYLLENSDEIDIVNWSWNYVCNTGDPYEYVICSEDPNYNIIKEMESIVNKIFDAGIPIVVSAGNQGINSQKVVPSIFQSVITTSAISDTDGKCGGLGSLSSEWYKTGEEYQDDSLAGFSNYGTMIDLAAPGVDILSTLPNNQYGEMSGTSMAAPHVAGALAVLKSHYPEYSASILNNVLSQEGSNQWTDCNFHGYGYFTDDNDPYSEPLLYVKNIQ
jgi:subtilisin family serine protease